MAQAPSTGGSAVSAGGASSSADGALPAATIFLRFPPSSPGAQPIMCVRVSVPLAKGHAVWTGACAESRIYDAGDGHGDGILCW